MKSNGFELFAYIPPTLAAAIITMVGLFSLNQLFTEANSVRSSSLLWGDKIKFLLNFFSFSILIIFLIIALPTMPVPPAMKILSE